MLKLNVFYQRTKLQCLLANVLLSLLDWLKKKKVRKLNQEITL